MGAPVYHLVCCVTSITVWLLMAESVERHPWLLALLTANAAISLSYHGYRLLTGVSNSAGHATALLRIDAVGATAGVAFVFLGQPEMRVPIVTCALLSGGSWLGLGETVSWVMHLGTHLILTRLALVWWRHSRAPQLVSCAPFPVRRGGKQVDLD